jgi:uncharacterized protein (TIGR02172 family)
VNPATEDFSAWKSQPTELVGKGFTSDIYVWGKGRVLKLFHPWVALSTVEREFRVTQAIHAAGLPAPATYDLVHIEGRDGIIFEHIEGTSMLTQVQARPWTLLRAVRQLADLHAQIHSRPAPLELPSQRERIACLIEAAPELSESEKRSAHHSLAHLPDVNALCHGDFHPENILFSRCGPIILDWGAAARGDPLSDVACTSRLMKHASLPPWTPRPMHFLLKCSRTLLHRSYLRRYLQIRPGTLAAIQAWEIPLAAAAKVWPDGLWRAHNRRNALRSRHVPFSNDPLSLS